MNKRLVSTVLVAAAVVVGLLALLGLRPARAQPPVSGDEVVRTVSVSGTGTVSAVPDQATIQVGARTQGRTAEEALDANNSRMTALIDALKRAGIAQRDIQTRDFSIWPQYRNPTSGESSISGYEVSNSVFITVRDLATFGATLDAAVRAGGNQVHSIQFGFNDPAALLDQARVAAMEEAARKAGQLAELAGAEVGAVVTISESGAVPPPVLLRGDMMAEAAAPVPVESGESSVTVTVQVTYELDVQG